MLSVSPPFAGRRVRGSVMVYALLFILVVGLALSALMPRVVFHHDNAYREVRYIAAQHLAEAGVEEALSHLIYDRLDQWTGWNTSNPLSYRKPRGTFADREGRPLGEYEVEIRNPLPLGVSIMIGGGANLWPMPVTASATPTIRAYAGVPDLDSPGSERRLIEVVARSRSIFSLGLFSDKTLSLGGTTVVNSYDSRRGPYHPVNNAGPNGDAGSNENITLNGTALIDGDAAAGGSVLVGNNAEITGEIEAGVTRIVLPPVDHLVEAARLYNNNAEIPLAVRKNGTTVQAYDPATKRLSVAANAVLTLPGGTKENPKVYYFSDGVLNGGSTLRFSGYVIIMTSGTLDFSGGTVINNAGAGTPDQLVVYSSGGLDNEIRINGGAGFAGAVYAPKSKVKFSGGGHIYGAFVGGQVDVIGNAQFHYDEALGNTGLIAYFDVNEWIEKRPLLAGESLFTGTPRL